MQIVDETLVEEVDDTNDVEHLSCLDCGKKFSNNLYLQNHIDVIKNIPGENVYRILTIKKSLSSHTRFKHGTNYNVHKVFFSDGKNFVLIDKKMKEKTHKL